jgi:hypothetical protein
VGSPYRLSGPEPIKAFHVREYQNVGSPLACFSLSFTRDLSRLRKSNDSAGLLVADAKRKKKKEKRQANAGSLQRLCVAWLAFDV